LYKKLLQTAEAFLFAGSRVICSMNNIVLITGATSGIGKACAQKFAAAKHDLIITGRRKDKLAELKTELESTQGIKVLTLCFDVQDKEAVFNAINHLPLAWQTISVLINNAGLALGRDSFENADLNDWETMLNTNVNGLLYVTRAVLPFMIAQKKGHIVNMGSVAGKEVYEKGNAYCASKFAVDALNRAMRIDLLKHNIKVTGIHPGAVETEFSLVRYKGDVATAAATYNGLKPLTGDDIADTIFYCCSLPAHVCINDLVITPTQQADAIYFNRNQ
jgi:NADP-dependent 3-hydroxy acid dehydrogenase YdfG